MQQNSLVASTFKQMFSVPCYAQIMISLGEVSLVEVSASGKFKTYLKNEADEVERVGFGDHSVDSIPLTAGFKGGVYIENMDKRPMDIYIRVSCQ